VAFVYADGVQHEDQMRGLGLFGGRERLPAIAFNTQDGKQIPFSERYIYTYLTPSLSLAVYNMLRLPPIAFL